MNIEEVSDEKHKLILAEIFSHGEEFAYGDLWDIKSGVSTSHISRIERGEKGVR